MSKEYIELDSAGYPHKVSESAAPAQPVLSCQFCGKPIAKAAARGYYHIDAKDRDACGRAAEPPSPAPVLTRCPTCHSLNKSDRGCIAPDCGMNQSHRKCIDCSDPWHDVLTPSAEENSDHIQYWKDRAEKAEAERPVLPVPPEIADRVLKVWQELVTFFGAVGMLSERREKSNLLLNELAEIQRLARSSSPAVAPTKTTIKVCSRCGFHENADNAAPAVAGRTQGDEALKCKRCGASIVVGECAWTYHFDSKIKDYFCNKCVPPIDCAAINAEAALRESAREAPSHFYGNPAIAEAWKMGYKAAKDELQRSASPEAPSHIECEGCGRSGPLSYVGRIYTPKTSTEAPAAKEACSIDLIVEMEALLDTHCENGGCDQEDCGCPGSRLRVLVIELRNEFGDLAAPAATKEK